MKEQPKVALIYVTCNDFIPDALDTCMNQTYPNTHTYILDDSTDFTYQQKIDAFREKHEKTDVIRRSKHLGFKAGNINHFLKKYDNWDYFVLLDSDEIIPNNFIEESIMFFMEDEKLGILQGNHVSTRNENRFMKRFFRGVDAHWATYQSEKELYGFFIFSWPWCLN
ncbi:glycosyltransferase [Fructobacillus durionis]|uniref:glycosyltransferase n=1 Tax=Fructobacillus durionis TaxID=283737 RepID=UPI003621E938